MHEAIENIYTVSEITREIKEALEFGIPPIWVKGEISNYVHHSSGHMYFSLKDEYAQITCVMWKSRNAGLTFKPEDGKTINAYGEITVYEKRGAYQLDIQKMALVGIGELQLAFEELKTKLRDEGLFDDSFKKSIPTIPQRIGIITSQTGAAIRDIVAGLNRRLPGVEKVLRPTLVQGVGAAQDIAAAIREFNEYNQVDVIILGRGGGSLEDLWAFNEEIVARAIFESKIPIVSAVGHQVDFTISDFVADVRAATPTAAAEIVTPDSRELKRTFQSNYMELLTSIQQTVGAKRDQLNYLSKEYAFRRPLDVVKQNRQKIDDLVQQIKTHSRLRFERNKESFSFQQKRFQALHPEAILQRGYAIAKHIPQNTFIRQATQLIKDDDIRIFFSKGAVDGRITKVDPEGDISKMN